MAAPDVVLRWKYLVTQNSYPLIKPELVLAVIWQESDGYEWAGRYEHRYQYFYDHHRNVPLYDKALSVEENRVRAVRILGVTEFNDQSKSWGLMQIMGAAARERRFKAPSLNQLCEPEANIVFSTLHLWKWGFQDGKRPVEEALQRYNGGGNPLYASKVLAKLAQIEGS